MKYRVYKNMKGSVTCTLVNARLNGTVKRTTITRGTRRASYGGALYPDVPTTDVPMGTTVRARMPAANAAKVLQKSYRDKKRAENLKKIGKKGGLFPSVESVVKMDDEVPTGYRLDNPFARQRFSKRFGVSLKDMKNYQEGLPLRRHDQLSIEREAREAYKKGKREGQAGCVIAYKNGYNEGYTKGREEGHMQGWERGWREGSREAAAAAR